MLEAAVGDGLHDLRLEQEVAEAGAVDADVAALAGSGHAEVAFLALGTASAVGGGGGLDLLIGVVDQVLFAC